MAERSAGAAKLLFVLTNDYGELANAMYFTDAQPFDRVLLMPERLFAANRDLAARTFRYRSLGEVLGDVEREDPDVVFLFSGYLFTMNGIFDVDTVAALVRDLHRRGMRVVTSDPFLGLPSRIDASTFSDRHPRRAWLVEHFTALWSIFRDVPHLYLVDPAGLSPARSLAFSNRALIAAPDALEERERALRQCLPLDPARRRWLHVLSSEDYGGQAALRGHEAFEALLAAKLRETAREGRQPILVGPGPCLDALRPRTADIDGLLLVPFVGYETFRSLLLTAEHAFYWNVFSNSIPARIANHRSIFFFDRGHMAHAIPAIYDLARARYYPDCTLEYLDPARPLAAGELARLAKSQEATFAGAWTFFGTPTPLEVVEGLVRP